MKTLFKVFPTITGLLFFACDTNPLDELTTFNVSDTFIVEETVDVPEDPLGGAYEYTYSNSFSIDDNTQINDNFGEIESLTIHELYFEIQNFEGNQEADFEDVVISIGEQSVALGTINPYQSDANDAKIQIGDAAFHEALAAALLQSPSVSVQLEGVLSDTPVKFDLVFTLYLTATITVL